MAETGLGRGGSGPGRRPSCSLPRVARIVLLLALLIAWLPGCSWLLDFGDECTKDADCAGRGANLVCRESLCVTQGSAARQVRDLLSEDCPQLYQEKQDSQVVPADTIILGLLLPHSGELGTIGSSMRDAALLAMEEINKVGGIGGRKLAALSCDDGTKTEQALRAAHHLAEVVHVPAIIGPAASGITISVLNEVALPNQVAVITPSGTSPALTHLQDQDLLWRTVPPDTFQGLAIARLLAHEKPAKVAVINRDDAYGSGLRDAFYSSFAGLTTVNETNYNSWSYDDEEYTDDQSRIALELVAFQPDALVLIAFVEDGISMLNMAASQGLPALRIVLPDGVKSEKVAIELDDQTMLDQIIGTNPASPVGQEYDSYTLRYKGKFRTNPGVFSSNTYDAFYLVAYASAAIRDPAQIAGPAIAANLKRLSSGTPVSPGGSSWPLGVAQLTSSVDATINYHGASGPLDFDPATGEAPSDVEAWYFLNGYPKSLGVILDAEGGFTYRAAPGGEGEGQGVGPGEGEGEGSGEEEAREEEAAAGEGAPGEGEGEVGEGAEAMPESEGAAGEGEGDGQEGAG